MTQDYPRHRIGGLSEQEVLGEAEQIAWEPGWPNWPLLPMKNIHRYEPDYTGPAYATLLAVGVHNGGERVLHLKSAGELKSGPLLGQFEGVNTLHFAGIEEMVRAGWIGD